MVGRLCHQVVDYDKDDTDNKVARYTIKRKREEAIPPPPQKPGVSARADFPPLPSGRPLSCCSVPVIMRVCLLVNAG